MIQGTKVVDAHVENNDFVARFSTKDYIRGGKLPWYCQLLVCEDEHPPQYTTRSGFISIGFRLQKQ